jgi:ubiquinone/menaquinone biosynthesis C-methylase UbiE
MTKSDQKSAFLDYEADAWLERNKIAVDKYSASSDEVVTLLQNYNVKPNRILEIGCSTGHRLNGVHSVFGDIDIYGTDPSSQAIEYGKGKYPHLKLTRGTADSMPQYESGFFDVVILGFFMYVVDRSILLQTMAEIDRVLMDKGILVIKDFFSEIPMKRKYAHINQFEAYSFKQNYDELFAQTKLYQLISRTTYNDITLQKSTDDYQNLESISILKKDLYAGYK